MQCQNRRLPFRKCFNYNTAMLNIAQVYMQCVWICYPVLSLHDQHKQRRRE